MNLKLSETDLNKLFFISDPHFYHANIIKYCNRPFSSMEEMNATLIERWNYSVPPDGIVVCSGDFIMTGQINLLKGLLNQLHGTIHLVYGNHDYQNRLNRQVAVDLFKGRVYDALHIILNKPDSNIYVSHYPHLFWPRGSYHLHGYVHSGPLSTSNEKVPFHYKRYDIGVDNNDYKPIWYWKLMEIFDNYKNIEDNVQNTV